MDATAGRTGMMTRGGGGTSEGPPHRVAGPAAPRRLVVVSATAFWGAAHLLDGRYAWARAVAWGESDTGDPFRFPERAVPAGRDVSPLPTGDTPASLTEPVRTPSRRTSPSWRRGTRASPTSRSATC